MESEEKKINKEREELEKWFERYYLLIPEGMKYHIGKYSIDFAGSIGDNYSLLLKVLRGSNNILIKYRQNGTDNHSDKGEFWFEFPIYHFPYLPSGYYIGELTKRGYELFLDKDSKIIVEYISKKVLEDQLVNDLIENNKYNFVNKFYEFLSELYNWTNKAVK
jgi:hypothetical protein